MNRIDHNELDLYIYLCIPRSYFTNLLLILNHDKKRIETLETSYKNIVKFFISESIELSFRLAGIKGLPCPMGSIHHCSPSLIPFSGNVLEISIR